jgi:ABC-2 type transport system permease protein
MADLFRGLSLLDPIRHFVEIVRAVFLKGEGYAGLWRQFTALALLAVGFLALAVQRLRTSTD